jgi:hypothetical protein
MTQEPEKSQGRLPVRKPAILMAFHILFNRASSALHNLPQVMQLDVYYCDRRENGA